MKTASAFAVLLLAMLAAQELLAVQAVIQCSDVINELLPCLDYLQGNEANPSAACCQGVTALYAAADTKPERQDTCECLKEAYRQYDVIISRAQALPGKCSLRVSYPITPDVNCSQIE